MSPTLSHHLNPVNTPQSEPLPGQVPNSAGGFTFAVDDWTRLARFLILGSEGGTYYVSERKLTVDNAQCVNRCLDKDGPRTLAEILKVSVEGRAPKNEPALLALALALKHGNPVNRQLAGTMVPRIARTGTHLFHLVDYIKALGGWKRNTKRAIANWYQTMPADRLALQVVKYQQRDGWSHRDVLRMAHPKAASNEAVHNAIYHYAVNGWEDVGEEPHSDENLQVIWAFERAKTLTSDGDMKALLKLITDYGLPHECVPNEMKKHPQVWEAMLPSMGMTAIIRNLAKMTNVGLLAPLSAASKYVVEKLNNVEALKKGRIHPLSILVALKTYAEGKGDKGSLTWKPVKPVVDALDGAFYSAFKAIEPTGKNHMLALDVSGSMTWNNIAGMPITPREASAAMSLVTANVESNYEINGFCDTFREIEITTRTRLDDILKYIDGLPASRTDCSLPIVHALENKIPVDVFCVYTDSETYAGSIHPHIALEKYRQKMGRPAKLIVIAMQANEFSIANPNDRGMMDIAGFDTASPSVMADFARE